MTCDPAMARLATLRAQGSLRDIDFHLADALRRHYGEREPAVLLAAALASRAVADGHACLDLAALAETEWPAADEYAGDKAAMTRLRLPALAQWLAALAGSRCCGAPPESDPPLRLTRDGAPRLYLRRYYLFERRIVARLLEMAQGDTPLAPPGEDVGRRLARLLPAPEQAPARLAAATALRRRLLILSGGPGSGKTHTLARILLLLLELRPELAICLAAPTGKAAARMRESIRAALLERGGEAPAALAGEATTLHRLLGARGDILRFRHNRDHPLPADIVIVDEASMIDLPLMARLLDALRPEARLLLLGDMHQLSSVAPGFVLGDICAAAQAESGAPLAGSLVELTHNWRFPSDGPVGRVSAAIKTAGTAADPAGERAWDTLRGQQGRRSEAGDEVAWHDMPATLRDAAGRPIKDLRRLVLAQFRPFLEATAVAEAFAALAQFRILCALRRGPHGVETLNRLTEEILALERMRFAPGDPELPARKLEPVGRFYDHRVVMILRNDYGLRLFNGDVGIVLPESAGGAAGTAAEDQKRLAAWFEVSDEVTGQRSCRHLPCHMLPEHETAFAMTIHKAQGSQFRDILLLLPPREHPLLTRELLYTGLTRAEKRVWLWCGESAFKLGATRRTARASGLSAALSEQSDKMLINPRGEGCALRVRPAH